MTPNYATLPDSEAAAAISQHIREWDTQEPLRYAGIGLMAVAVENRMLWQYVVDPADGMPCRSFSRWIRVVAPAGYSTIYAAKKDIEELHDVPAEDLAQIPQSSFRPMRQLSTAVRRDPAVLAEAKKGCSELVAHVKKAHPDQHIEKEAFLKVPLSETRLADVQDAVKHAMERKGCESLSDVVWMWAVDELSSDDVPLADVSETKCGHA